MFPTNLKAFIRILPTYTTNGIANSTRKRVLSCSLGWKFAIRPSIANKTVVSLTQSFFSTCSRPVLTKTENSSPANSKRNQYGDQIFTDKDAEELAKKATGWVFGGPKEAVTSNLVNKYGDPIFSDQNVEQQMKKATDWIFLGGNSQPPSSPRVNKYGDPIFTDKQIDEQINKSTESIFTGGKPSSLAHSSHHSTSTKAQAAAATAIGSGFLGSLFGKTLRASPKARLPLPNPTALARTRLTWVLAPLFLLWLRSLFRRK